MKKGALQACGCGDRKRRMAEGGSVDDMSEGEYYRRLILLNENRGGGRRREELNASRGVNLPLQTARGWAAGTLGLPGDLQKLGRGAWAGLRAAPGSGISAALEAMGEPSTLPDTDFYREWLPGYDASPAARAASGLGSFAGGAGATTVARGAARAAKGAQGALGTLADAVLMPVPRRQAQLGAIRMKGGNFDTKNLQGMLEAETLQASPEVAAWYRKNLGNYIRKDLGAPTDPLLKLEQELPDLHLPEGSLTGAPARNQVDNLYVSAGNRDVGGAFVESRKKIGAYLDKHHELSGGARLTPWGRESDAQIYKEPARNNLGREFEDTAPSWATVVESPRDVDSIEAAVQEQVARGRRMSPRTAKEYTAALEKAKGDWRYAQPDADIHSLMGEAPEQLGFNHIRDYLEAATDPYRRIRQNFGPNRIGLAEGQGEASFLDAYNRIVRGPEGVGAFDGMHPYRHQDINNWRRLENAGLTIDPASLDRMSITDAVRKTAEWNKLLASKAGGPDGALSKGWQVHKEYPEKGMKWVKFGKPEFKPYTKDTLPEGYEFVTDTVPDDVANQSLRGKTLYGVRRKGGAGPTSTGDWHNNPGLTEDEGVAHFNEWAARELGRNDLKDGLNAEGEAMGHCVGGYCDEVANNGTEIYSLRDAKGRPHVTVEVSPGQLNPRDWFHGQPDEVVEELRAAHNRYFGGDEITAKSMNEIVKMDPRYQADLAAVPRGIAQVKGKQNAAPVKDYLPYVQDFVKSGQWGRVGDLGNTGLVKFSGGKTNLRDTPVDLKNQARGAAKRRVFENIDMPSGYMTSNEASEFLQKQGVPKDMADAHVGSYNFSGLAGTRQNYAEGGPVHPAPDPYDELDHALDIACINCEGTD